LCGGLTGDDAFRRKVEKTTGEACYSCCQSFAWVGQPDISCPAACFFLRTLFE